MTSAQKVIKYIATAFAIFLIVSIISAILSVFYGLSGFLGLKSNKKSNKEMNTTNFENSNIATLEIEVNYTNLIIKKGEYFKVETNNSDIDYKQNNQSLKIEENNKSWFAGNNNEDLIVYIPENLEFEEVQINSKAGKINIENIVSNKLSFELGAGEVEIKSLNVLNNADIKSGAGKVNILSGTINNLDMDMGVGEVNIAAQLTGKSKMDSGIGKLDIDLNGKREDYKIKISKGIGSVKINGKETSGDTTYGEGENYIEVDGGIGSISIDLKN